MGPVATQPGETIAYDAHSGTIRWRSPLGPGSDISGVHADAGVATGIGKGGLDELIAVDVISGRQLWSRPGQQPARLDSAEGNVFAISPAPAGTEEVSAIDARTGRTRWSHAVGDSPSAAGHGLVIGGGERSEIVASNANTGTMRWKVDAPDTANDGSTKVLAGAAAVIAAPYPCGG